jgi:hypothetical protein
MIDFDRIVYKYPILDSRAEAIEDGFGLDTEAFDTGEPFLVCLSDGAYFHPNKFPEFLINRPKYRESHFFTYNLRYDAGALLYFFTPEEKITLWERTKVKHNNCIITYIPHKYLGVQCGRKRLHIWDISQYFRMSLDRAAKKYLIGTSGETGKDGIETKSFNKSYVKGNIGKIRQYCIRDASLTKSLGMYLISKLSEFGIVTSALYSNASLSFRYFADNANICTVWRLWKYSRECLRFAQESYSGGKFEITSRGKYYGYEYDLVSAYPYEISNLIDIRTARVECDKKIHNDAVYGFLRVRINNVSGLHIPCGLMVKNVVIYPAGIFYTTITKEEYDYIISLGIDVKVYSAYWVHVDTIKYPYKDVVDNLFRLKSEYKKKDLMLSIIAKTMLNSFYGKTIQLTPDWKSNLNAGTGYNPIHAAVITANTRIKVTKMQNRFRDNCVAVHTDSIMLKEPLPQHEITDKIGEFSFKHKGDGILVACGQYDLYDHSAFKGFNPKDDPEDYNGETLSWKTLLSKHKEVSQFSINTLRVQSWTDAASKGKFDKVNYFDRNFKKTVNLNGDSKRNWPSIFKGKDFLEKMEHSEPLILIQNKKPSHWNEQKNI